MLFADDSSLLQVIDNPINDALSLNSDLEKIHLWSTNWLMELNPAKTEEMCFTSKRLYPVHPPLFLNKTMIKSVSSHKHIGVIFSSNMSWHQHIESIVTKASKSVQLFSVLKFKLSRQVLEKIYKSFIRSLLEYADIVWHGCTIEESNLVERIQYHCSLIVTGAIKGSSYSATRKELGWESLSDRRHIHRLLLFHNIVNGLTREYLTTLLPYAITVICNYDLRNSRNLRPIRFSTDRFGKSFTPYSITAWNNLDLTLRTLDFSKFREHLFKTIRPPKFSHFSFGSRHSCILISRLRMGTCSLNYSLFTRGLVSSPACSCGCPFETISHYLLHCPTYNYQRSVLIGKLSGLLVHILDFHSLANNAKEMLILQGSSFCSFNFNCRIIEATHVYIATTNRF